MQLWKNLHTLWLNLLLKFLIKVLSLVFIQIANDIKKNLAFFEIPTLIFSEPEDLNGFQQKEALKFPLTKFVAKYLIN